MNFNKTDKHGSLICGTAYCTYTGALYKLNINAL